MNRFEMNEDFIPAIKVYGNCEELPEARTEDAAGGRVAPEGAKSSCLREIGAYLKSNRYTLRSPAGA